MNGIGGLDENPTPPGLSSFSPLNYSAASQFSMFVPLGQQFCDRRERHRIENWKWRARRTIRSRLVEHPEPDRTPGKLTNQWLVHRASSSPALSWSRAGLALAPVVGVEIESLQGTGSLAAQILSTAPSSSSIERINSGSTISQSRITAGVERDLPHGQKLGFFYRYGLIEAAENDTSHTVEQHSKNPSIPLAPLAIHPNLVFVFEVRWAAGFSMERRRPGSGWRSATT